MFEDKTTINFNNINDIINNVKHYINIIFKGAKMNVDKIPEWVFAMEQEDITFIKKFMLESGSLKEIAKLYKVSYPTVRLRLDRIIQIVLLGIWAQGRENYKNKINFFF